MNSLKPAHLALFRAALAPLSQLAPAGDAPLAEAATAAALPLAGGAAKLVQGAGPAAAYFNSLPWVGGEDGTRTGETTIDALRATVHPFSATSLLRAPDASASPARAGAAGFFGALPWTGEVAQAGTVTQPDHVSVEPAPSGAPAEPSNLVALATAQALQTASASAGADGVQRADHTASFFAQVPWEGRANAS